MNEKRSIIRNIKISAYLSNNRNKKKDFTFGSLRSSFLALEFDATVKLSKDDSKSVLKKKKRQRNAIKANATKKFKIQHHSTSESSENSLCFFLSKE